MSNQEWIDQQQDRLEAHRQTLLAYLHQQAVMDIHTPPYVVNGIAQARAQISQIKADLRAAGVAAPDLPTDAHQPAPVPPDRRPAGISISRSTVNGDIVNGSMSKTVNHNPAPYQASSLDPLASCFTPLHQAITHNIPTQHQPAAFDHASQLHIALAQPDLDLPQLESALRWFHATHPSLHYILHALLTHPTITHIIAVAGKTAYVRQLLATLVPARSTDDEQ